MRRRMFTTAAAMAALVGLASLTSACATAPSAQEAPVAAAEPAAPPVVDQAAIDALTRMSTFLRGLKTFEVAASTEIDEVMDDGQKLQFAGKTTYKVQRPDRMFVQLVGDRKVRQVYYDGKTVTVASPRMGFYAVVDAPPTIAEMLDLARDKYDIEIPLADLFRWGTEQIPADVIQGARVVGYASVNGVDTDHYAFRGAEVDWQIWIARGDRPFPAKVVITSKNEDQSPQYSAELAWSVPSSLPASTFAFKPPQGAVKITVADAAATDNQDDEVAP